MSALIKYDQARQALAACRSVDEIKDMRDKSEALRLYAKQAHDTELEQWAAEIKLRAQRAIGELSAALATQQGGFGIVPTGGKHKAEVLAEAGISTSAANRYEKLAAIPAPVIEDIIAKSKELGKPVSVKAVMAQVAPKPEHVTPAASPTKVPAAALAPIDDVLDLGVAPVASADPASLDQFIDDLDDGHVPDLEETNTALEREIERQRDEIAKLKAEVARLGGTDQAARIQALCRELDEAYSLASSHRSDFVKANEQVVKYDKLLRRLRRVAGVDTNSEIERCIVRATAGA